MKKILVCTGYFFPHLGGHERYVEELYSRLPVEKFQVHVLTIRTGSAADQEVYRGLTIHRVDGWDLLGGTFPVPKPNRHFFSTVSLLRREGFQIINTHTRFFVMSLVGAWLAKKWRVFHFHTEHGTAHPRSTPIVQVVAWVYDQSIGRLVIKAAKIVIGISEASVNFSRHLGATRTKIFYNGVDTDYFFPAKNKAGDGKSLVFVGRLIRAKGVADLLAAVRGVDMPGWSLEIVGGGPDQARLQELADDLTNVHFHGPASAEKIRTVLQQADIFVNPSYGEGLPTGVLEAGSCGCAIIATDVGGTREIFPNAARHWLIPPGDAKGLQERMRELMANPQKRHQLGLENRAVMEGKFSWTTITENFRSWIEEIPPRPNLSPLP